MIVCLAASLLAAVRLFLFRSTLTDRKHLPFTLLSLAAIGGTIAVLATPALHTPMTGLVWTLLCLAAVTTLFYRTLFDTSGFGRSAILLGLRLLAILLLVLMLFEPVLRYTQTRAPDRPLYLLVDRSGSMSVPDVQNGPTRIQSVWQALRPQLDKLKPFFDIRVRTFASDVQTLPHPEDLAALPADGQSTDIVKAVSHILNETARKDAAIVLISDGIDNTTADVPAALAPSQRPIHTLAVGSEQTASSAIMNVAVESIDADEELAVGHETKLTANIISSGLANRVVDVKWASLDPDGKPLTPPASQKLVLEPRPAGQKLEIPFKPTTVGIQRIAVWIDPIPGERTTVDNRQEYQGLALDPRIKVLYIEGRLRPEFHDLNRALQRDANIEVASLLRIQQNRFTASGTVDGESFKAMPQTQEQWRKFDVIIIGDLDISFLSGPQQNTLEQVISDGAGLLMMGGQSSFGPGSYANTPIEKALPVFVGDTSAPQEKSEFVPRLTPAGAMHPAMEGLTDWFGVGDKPGQRTLPPIRGNVVVPRAKTGASILLTHPGKTAADGSPQIVLAVENYGKGRSAAFTADTTFLWYLPLRGMGQDSPYNRFWGQLVRWLAGADVKNRQQGAGLEGMLNRSVFRLGETVNLKAMVRDERGDATRYAIVQMQLKDSAGKDVQRANLAPSSARNGLYELNLAQLKPGDYQLELSATKDGKNLGTHKQLKFTIIAPADELLNLAAKPQLLAEISRYTRGYSYPLAQISQLVNQLVHVTPDSSPVRQVNVPLCNLFRIIPALVGHPPTWATQYDLPMQAVLILGLLMVEWLLRRRWQLT